MHKRSEQQLPQNKMAEFMDKSFFSFLIFFTFNFYFPFLVNYTYISPFKLKYYLAEKDIFFVKASLCFSTTSVSFKKCPTPAKAHSAVSEFKAENNFGKKGYFALQQ